MGTISIEHSDRLYWLGRYTERVFTTLKILHKLIDRMLESKNCYTEYLKCLGLDDTYKDNKAFIHSFLYDSRNPDSIAYSLERAYDNGIVLREEISTDSLSFLQLAKDTLAQSEGSVNIRFSLLPLEDLLFGFWGCIEDHGTMIEAMCASIIDDISGSDVCIDVHSSNIFLKGIPQIRMSVPTAPVLLPYAKMMNVDFIWIHESATVLESTLSHGPPEKVIDCASMMELQKRITSTSCLMVTLPNSRELPILILMLSSIWMLFRISVLVMSTVTA